MWKTLAIAAAVATASVSVAQAAPRTTAPQNNHFSWTYADLGLSTHDYDGWGDNLTSLDGDISFAINDNLYALGGGSLGDSDYIDTTNLHGGLGFHMPLIEKLDLLAEGELEWTNYEVDHTNNSESETGFTLRAGVRHRTTDKLELEGGVYHTDIVDSDSGLFGQALFHLNRQFDAGARLALGGDTTVFGIFGRVNF